MDRFVTRLKYVKLEEEPSTPPDKDFDTVWLHATGGAAHRFGPSTIHVHQLYRWKRHAVTKNSKFQCWEAWPYWDEAAWANRKPKPCFYCGHLELVPGTSCYREYLDSLNPHPDLVSARILNKGRVFSSPDQVIEHLPPSHGTHH